MDVVSSVSREQLRGIADDILIFMISHRVKKVSDLERFSVSSHKIPGSNNSLEVRYSSATDHSGQAAINYRLAGKDPVFAAVVNFSGNDAQLRFYVSSFDSLESYKIRELSHNYCYQEKEVRGRPYNSLTHELMTLKNMDCKMFST